MKILIVNRFFGGAQIPTGRMAEDVARVLVEEGHEVVALASSGEYVGAARRADGIRHTAPGIRKDSREKAQEDLADQHRTRDEVSRTRNDDSPQANTEIPADRTTETPDSPGTLRVEQVRVPKWMPRALAWLWFTWQARKRIPRMDWDVCVLMTDPPLLPLLARRAAGMRHTADGRRKNSHEEAREAAAGKARGQDTGNGGQSEVFAFARSDSGVTTKRRALQLAERPTDTGRRVAVWLMDLYPEALAASGRLGTGNPIYRWYFSKRQKALAASDLLICLGHAQKELLGDGRMERGAWSVEREADGRRGEEGKGEGEVGASVGQYFSEAGKTEIPKYRNTEPLCGALTDRVRTVVVPPWDDRGNIALATEDSLKNLALYAGNLGEAHCFEEILSAAPHLPGDWTIRFAARGAKLAALKAAADGIRQAAYGIRTEAEGPVEYAGPVKLSSDSPTSRAEHSTGQGGLKLTDLRLKTAGAVVRGQAERRQGTGDRRQGAAVEITGYASEEETPGLLASALVHLITMSPGWKGIVVPSKLYGCIRTGRPVLFIGPENADTAREIRAHDWGKVLPPRASGKEVAGAILELAVRETRAVRSENGAREIAKLLETLATAERSEP